MIINKMAHKPLHFFSFTRTGMPHDQSTGMITCLYEVSFADSKSFSTKESWTTWQENDYQFEFEDVPFFNTERPQIQNIVINWD